MGAASYIGRIGGLAVALGVGTAIVTGQGVAICDRRRARRTAAHRRGRRFGVTRPATIQTTATDDTRQDRGQAFPDLRHRSDAIGPPTRRPAPSRPHRSFGDCRMLPKRPRSGWPTRSERRRRDRRRQDLVARNPALGRIVSIGSPGRAGRPYRRAHIGSWHRVTDERLRYRQRRRERVRQQGTGSQGMAGVAPRRGGTRRRHGVDRFHPDVAVDTAALPHRAGRWSR